jgi:hypothetical protein
MVEVITASYCNLLTVSLNKTPNTPFIQKVRDENTFFANSLENFFHDILFFAKTFSKYAYYAKHFFRQQMRSFE